MLDGSTFPNPLSPDATKDSPEFGIKFMRAAYDKWKTGVNESSSSRKSRFEYNRLFASGKQPMQEYKDILDLDGEESVIQLSYEPLPIAIPFLNRMYDRCLQRTEKIQCNSIDPLSQSKKEKAKADALFKMKNKEKIMALQNEAGMQLEEFTDDDPEDEKELEIQFGFNYKSREEVIMEQGIDIVLYDNDWDVIKKRILKDLSECGIAQIVPYINSNGRIKIDFTKPEDIISSYTEWDDFRDCQYQGRAYMMSIYDIRIKYPKVVEKMGGEQKLYELAISQRGINGNPSSINFSWNSSYGTSLARPYDSFKVPVIDMSLKTLNNLKYEVNRDSFGKEVLDRPKNIKPNKQYIQSNPYEVEYSGCWIRDTEWLLEWGLAKNMVKPQDNLTEVKLPYITYMYDNNEMSNKPLIEMMIPSIKMMQLIELQEQKIIANAAPDGYDIDISTMSDIDIGNGQGDLNPYQLYKIYKQTGVKYYKRVEDDGEGQRSVPITPNNVPFSGKLEQLMTKWNAEYDKLNRIIGDNNLAAGVITNQATGKGVLQEAKQISESASNYIYLGYINMMQRGAKMIMYRLWDILVYGKKFGVNYYDGYAKALGSDKVEYIKVEATDDFEKMQFDVKVQAVLDDREAQVFEQNIQMVLGGDPTMLPDVTEARQLAKTNMKYATYFLMSRYKKRLRQKQQEIAQNNEEMRQATVAGAQAKSQGEMELATLKSELKKQEDISEINKSKETELIKYTSILKVKIAEAILAKEGSSINDLPDFVLSGIGLIDRSNEQLILEEMQNNEQEEQQMMQQQNEMPLQPTETV